MVTVRPLSDGLDYRSDNPDFAVKCEIFLRAVGHAQEVLVSARLLWQICGHVDETTSSGAGIAVSCLHLCNRMCHD
jgi:hypothetical protein